MCVGCSRGFEIVDLESLDTQGLLDPNDESLEFVRKKETLRPMAIYRIQSDFLLCYDGWAFTFSLGLYFAENSHRIRILCQQKRPSITERIYGVLGGHANRLWYVI